MSRRYGAKYDAKLGTAQIAARIRDDVRSEQDAGALAKDLRVDVTPKRLSDGSSITVLVTAVPQGFRFVKAGHLESRGSDERAPERYTSAGQALLRKLESIVSAYNYDGGDGSADFSDVKFHKRVEYEAALEEHHLALAAWESQNPGASFCGQADPNAYCGKPFVRGCDYHDHQFLMREAAPA